MGPVTIQYQTYVDDKRESMTATSSSLPGPLKYTYSYQTDGLRQSLTTSGAPDGNVSFAWKYSPAGRKLSQSDNFLVTDSTTYDAYGRANSLAFSAGSLSTLTYDQRDNLTGYVTPATPSPATIYYDGLDEVVSYSGAVPCAPSWTRSYTDGVMSSTQSNKTTPCTTASFPQTNTIDPRNGRIGGSSYSGTPAIGPYAFTDNMTFDAAGRESGGSSVITGRSPLKLGGYTTYTEDGTYSTTYDNEDHVQTQVYNDFANGQDGATSGTRSYVWGLDDHPEQLTTTAPLGTPVARMLHWDGDVPLFTSVAGGVVCTYVEQLAQCGSVLDRDQSGGLVEIHNATGSTGVCPSTLFPSVGQYTAVCFNATASFSYPNDGYPDDPLTYKNSDGLEFLGPYLGGGGTTFAPIVFQGTRTYNSGVGQWTTPDAYAGEVDDPMTQRSYVWNRNNPVKYADPSGFDTIYLIARDAKFFSAAHLFIEVKDDSGKVTQRYSFGPSRTPLPGAGSKLVQKGSDYDAGNDVEPKAWGTTVIASCSGKCTLQNGGVDESMLPVLAAVIGMQDLGYNGLGPNSNSAAYSLCVGIGSNNCGNPNTGGHVAPGYGMDLLDGGYGTPPGLDTNRWPH